jgi:hypothetical protein
LTTVVAGGTIDAPSYGGTMMEDEVGRLRDENERLTRAIGRIAQEVGALPDLESCLAAIRRIKLHTLAVKRTVPTFRTLYHITSRDNLLSLRQEGLKCHLGPRSQADGFAVPLIHCFEDKLAVEEAIAGWVLDVFGHDGGFLILEFVSHGPMTSGKSGPVLLDDVPFSAISVSDECFCPEDLAPSLNEHGLVDLEEAIVWLRENGCSTRRDGSRLIVDIHDDDAVIDVVREGVRAWELESTIGAREGRRDAYLQAVGFVGC